MKTQLVKICFLTNIGMALFFTSGCEKDDPVKFAGGMGTVAEPYLIETPKQLDAVRHNLNKHFKQIADIDLSGYSSGAGWQPIGYENDPFTGTYDGDGYKITDLTIYEEIGGPIGLFRYTDKSTIKNIALELINVVSAKYGNAGGLVGWNKGNITNCHTTGDVSGEDLIGGLVGRNGELYDEGFIKNSYATGVVSGNNYAGGLVGEYLSGNIEYSYYDKETTGQDDTGKGIPRTTAEMMQQSTF